MENDVGVINIPREERDALNAIDSDTLGKLIEISLDEKRSSSLRVLRLESCGPYVASRLWAFEKALGEYSAAKATKKIAETADRARRAGNDLANVMQQMKHRLEEEGMNGQLFYVEDSILPPHRFSECLTVRVSYRWRSAIEEKWEHGSVTFTHDVDFRPDYTMPLPKRKPSAGEQERDRQDRLYREWEHLMQLGLCSVRDFLKEGGNAAEIPEAFQAKADSHTGRLNNFSTKFWLGDLELQSK